MWEKLKGSIKELFSASPIVGFFALILGIYIGEKLTKWTDAVNYESCQKRHQAFVDHVMDAIEKGKNSAHDRKFREDNKMTALTVKFGNDKVVHNIKCLDATDSSTCKLESVSNQQEAAK